VATPPVLRAGAEGPPWADAENWAFHWDLSRRQPSAMLDCAIRRCRRRTSSSSTAGTCGVCRAPAVRRACWWAESRYDLDAPALEL